VAKHSDDGAGNLEEPELRGSEWMSNGGGLLMAVGMGICFYEPLTLQVVQSVLLLGALT
jgi:hypothetical protein